MQQALWCVGATTGADVLAAQPIFGTCLALFGAVGLFAANPALLARYRSGDPSALDAVYRFYQADVTCLLRRGFWLNGVRVPGLDRRPADLADVRQDVFLRAWSPSVRASFDDTRPFRPLLFTIARRALVDCHRARGREIAVDPLTSDPLCDPVFEGHVRGADASDAWLCSLVQRYVAGLPRELLRLHEERFVNGTSQVEAANALGLSRQQVRTLEDKLIAGVRHAPM